MARTCTVERTSPPPLSKNSNFTFSCCLSVLFRDFWFWGNYTKIIGKYHYLLKRAVTVNLNVTTNYPLTQYAFNEVFLPNNGDRTPLQCPLHHSTFTNLYVCLAEQDIITCHYTHVHRMMENVQEKTKT